MTNTMTRQTTAADVMDNLKEAQIKDLRKLKAKLQAALHLLFDSRPGNDYGLSEAMGARLYL